MPVYRLYRIGRDNHFVGTPLLITCGTDDEAIAKARELGEPHDTELWNGKKRIAQIKAQADG